MTPYKSRSGKKSGVAGYRIGADYIIVQFTNGTVYKYSYKSCGQTTTETMKQLARASLGLSTFISQNDPAYTK
jgi:hypothetical protein